MLQATDTFKIYIGNLLKLLTSKFFHKPGFAYLPCTLKINGFRFSDIFQAAKSLNKDLFILFSMHELGSELHFFK